MRSAAEILKDDLEAGYRAPFVSRPRVGKTERKRRLPGQGTKTNLGDPMPHGSTNAGKRGA